MEIKKTVTLEEAVKMGLIHPFGTSVKKEKPKAQETETYQQRLERLKEMARKQQEELNKK